MKKILSILLCVTMLGGVVFAQEGGLTPEVEASASVSWGIDLGAGKSPDVMHGFENLFKAKVTIPLYMGTLSSKTEGDVNVSFDIGAALAYQFDGLKSNSTSPHKPWDSDAELGLWRNKLHSMKATLNFWEGYLNVYNRPDFYTNYAQIWQPLRDDGDAWGPETSGDITAFGTKLGYKSDDLAGSGLSLDTGLKLASNGSWKAEEKTSDRTVTFEKKPLKKGDELKAEENVLYYKDADVIKSHGKVDGKNVEFLAIAPGVVGQAQVAPVASDEVWYAVKTVEASTAKPVQGMYAIGWDFSLGYKEYINFGFGINATFNPVKKFGNVGTYTKDGAAGSNEDKVYLGLGFKVSSKPVDGLELSVASDILANCTKDNKVAADVVFNTSYKWASIGLYYGNKYSAYSGTDKDGKDTGDMAMKIAFASKADGDTNLVSGLAFGADFRLNHMLTYIPESAKENGSTLPFGFTTWVNYKHNFTDSMWIKPYVTVWGESNHDTYADDTTEKKGYLGVAYNVGVTFSPVEKFELDAKWSQGKLNWNNYEGKYDEGDGMIGVPANHKCHNGTFVLSAKIIY